ncbi:MAG: amino acid transporter [Moorea sp. SIO1G6]|nr:amino acid transporter [Moorena sp. SIO3B2]NEP69622.1 amino acid transporter [Moorena sp. SIO3A5]NEQ06155.1 amino acid transporter [Moorena sp. SIO4E2]NER89476.1 amino acid transporter [Moorena sp. SIO3A2]NET67809.1 amino acid transporter [Moorena sp. SIO1G6]OLT69161.1 amino acid transporter [Moorena producens 3L]
MLTAFLSGTWLGFSLLVAIGGQNAFILKQGLKQEHVFIICLICALSDAILIAFGVSEFHVIIEEIPWIEEIARDFGAIFLTGYGIRSFWLAAKSSDSLIPSTDDSTSLAIAITTCLAFTWLNPHVYLDTVVLVGSISTHYSTARIQFALGAISASFIFFFTLGYGSRMLSPIFSNPRSWKILDIVIGAIMFMIAISLFL